jgi:hypothetical protein
MNADIAISLVALLVSIITLGVSIHFWLRQFRPLVTVAVRTASASPMMIAYKLEVMNSGTIPAKDIALSVDEGSLAGALGADATPDNKARWLACFTPHPLIRILHNGSSTSCSFGTTKASNAGFWKTRAQIAIKIKYEGWFGKRYLECQVVEIVDSGSFTGFMWGDGDA